MYHHSILEIDTYLPPFNSAFPPKINTYLPLSSWAHSYPTQGSKLESKLERLSPSSRWILFKNTGSAVVEREARQPRARQRHLRRGEPPDTRIMMSGLGLHLMASLRVENGPFSSPYYYCYRGLYGSAAEANGAVAAADSGGRR